MRWYDLVVSLITVPRLIICVTLFGVYFVNYQKNRVGFLIHMVSASAWAAYWVTRHEYEAAGSMAFSAFTSIVGWYRWRKLQ